MEENKEHSAAEGLVDLLKANPRLKALVLQSFPIERRTHPYRCKAEAERIRPLIDTMIETGKDIEFPFAAYEGLYKKTTLRQMIFNAIAWLAYDSGEIKYSDWRNRIRITTSGTGIQILYNKTLQPVGKDELNIVTTGAFVATFLDSVTPKAKTWKEELFAFIEESKPGDVFVREGLTLSKEDIESVETIFKSLDNNWMGGVFFNKVKLIHMKAEGGESE